MSNKIRFFSEICRKCPHFAESYSGNGWYCDKFDAFINYCGERMAVDSSDIEKDCIFYLEHLLKNGNAKSL